MNSRKYTVVSLFSGAGGMDLGFELEGFRTIWANDNDKDSCDTHLKWSGTHIVCAPIEGVDTKAIPKADVVLGGFPCQGFSLAGPRKVDDKRNSLYRHFVSVIEGVKPLAFVAENVKGILTLGKGEIIKAIINEFEDKGYVVQFKLLNAAHYGVPQDRYRVLMVGIRRDIDVAYHYPEPFKHKIVIRDTISKLPRPKDSEICQSPYSSRYMSRNRIRGWDQVSFTIPAMAKQVPLHPSSPPMKKIHSDLWKFSNPKQTRRLSWKEAAAIQTFPRDLVFCGNLTSIYKQIGNAVPVNLARAVASELHKVLEQVGESEYGSDTNELRQSVRVLVS